MRADKIATSFKKSELGGEYQATLSGQYQNRRKLSLIKKVCSQRKLVDGGLYLSSEYSLIYVV